MEEDRYLTLIKSLIRKKRGIDLDIYRKNYILRRIRIRMVKTRHSDFSEYYSFLLLNDEEIQKLIDTIGINVSRFYRDRDVFDIISSKISSYLKSKNSFIKGWSAGCAGGEETYTLAIVFFHSSIKDFRILGTDFDEEVIENAREGIFEPESLLDIPQSIRLRYFRRLEDNRFEVQSFIKEKVEFKLHDILSEPPEKDFDIILCRNVLIYMKRDAQKKVFENLTSVLKRDGFLVIGKVEMLPPEFERLYEAIDLKAKIFKKIA